jgi:hypothetical protein
MKKLLLLTLIAATAVAIPAYAGKPADPGSQGREKAQQKSANLQRCKKSVLTRAYVFGGTLTEVKGIQQTQGQATTTTKDDRYNVDLSLTVTHANKFAKSDHPKNSTFNDTLNDVIVRLGKNTDGSTRNPPQAGDHVTIHGRQAFKTKRNCEVNLNQQVGSTTFKSVNFGDQPTT